MGNGGDIFDRTDLHAGQVERPDRRLAPGTGSLYPHFYPAESHIQSLLRRLIRRLLSGIGRVFPGALKTNRSCRRPGNDVPVLIGQRYDGVVKGRFNGGNTFGINLYFSFLLNSSFGWQLQYLLC